MKQKPLLAMILGASLMTGLQCQTAQAQPIVLNPLTPGGPADTGTSVLADALGANTGPEAITISWSVSESSNRVYTYIYTVNNPVGDVVLDNNGNPTLTPEIVDAYSVGFDTTQPGNYIMNSQTGGLGSMQKQLPDEKRHVHNIQKYAFAARGCFILQSTA